MVSCCRIRPYLDPDSKQNTVKFFSKTVCEILEKNNIFNVLILRN